VVFPNSQRVRRSPRQGSKGMITLQFESGRKIKAPYEGTIPDAKLAYAMKSDDDAFLLLVFMDEQEIQVPFEGDLPYEPLVKVSAG